MYFSKSEMGFYDPKIHKELPKDVIEVEESRYKELMEGQKLGLEIGVGVDGEPTLLTRQPQSRETVTEARRLAYSNPLTGSDRYFAEAVRMREMEYPESEIATVLEMGRTRYLQIQEEYPYPPEE